MTVTKLIKKKYDYFFKKNKKIEIRDGQHVRRVGNNCPRTLRTSRRRVLKLPYNNFYMYINLYFILIVCCSLILSFQHLELIRGAVDEFFFFFDKPSYLG